jgi:thiol-disulfide isomerase/thioredoxin
MWPFAFRIVAATLFVLSGSCPGAPPVGASASGKRPEGSAPEFPSDPSQWVNSPPISTEALKGKGVFLWYFEESCPTCRGKWPSLLATAQKYEGKPVLFMAVNSGTSRGEIQQYAQETGITWPIIVDPSREFEQKSGVNEISLQNIYQVRLITADGRSHAGDFRDIEGSITRALDGAKWRVDPAEITPALRAAWTAIEFGNFTAAASAVKRALASSNPALKKAGEKLNGAVQKEMEDELAPIKKALENDEKWDAYKVIASVAQRYRGYSLPESIESDRKRLADDPKVKEELAAKRILDGARKLIAKSNTRRRGMAQLKKLVQDQPETEAGQRAKELVEP